MRRGRAMGLGLCVAVFAPIADTGVSAHAADAPRAHLVAATTEDTPAVQGDTVSINQGRALGTTVMNAAIAAAGAAGGRSAVLGGGTFLMRRMWRGSDIVQMPRANLVVPMTFTAVDPLAASTLYGSAIGDALAAGKIVMGETSAALRDARPGDVAEVIGWNRQLRKLTIAVVSSLAPSELLMSTETARVLGSKRRSWVIVWSFSSRDAIETQLAAHGLLTPTTRVRRSWEPHYADDTLSQARMKGLLGEFAMRNTSAVVIDRVWRGAKLIEATFTIGAKKVMTKCHRDVVAAADAAFAEINELGLAPAIVVRGRWNTVGCQSSRTVRSFGSNSGGNLSRHAWGGALDFNVRSNCMGCVPKIDCRVVQIFRAHGFAWGGNFLIPDGMHFEYVGEPRHELPTRVGAYCPTGVEPPGTGSPTVALAFDEG